MAFTYNSSNVFSSGLATVRFLTGEISSGTAVLADETINAVLDNRTANHYLAAAICCEALEAHWADYVDTDNEGLSVKGSQRAAAYRKKAASLRRQAGMAAGMYVGGRSISEKNDRETDTDLVQPTFSKGMDDFPGTVASSTGDNY